MSKNIQYHRILRAVQSEEKKDELEVQRIKQSYINQLKKMKKEDLFPKPTKLTLWQRLKIMIWGT